MPPNLNVTLRTLSLGVADATTGWYAKSFADSTIKMWITPQGTTIHAGPYGLHATYAKTGFTDSAITLGSIIRDAANKDHIIRAVEAIPIGDSDYCYQADLQYDPTYADRPSTSGTWPTIDDPAHRQKVFLDEKITPANLKEDDNATNATYITCLGMPDYPVQLVFLGTKNVDLIFSIAEARTTALVDHDYKAYAYENDVDVEIYAIDKSTITGRRLIYAAERELQLILEGYPTGSLRSYGKGEPQPKDLGSCRLWSKRVTIHYTRKKTE